MRTLLFLISAALCLPAFAQNKLPCQAKLDHLEKFGFNQKAVLNALNNVKTFKLNEDVIVLAKLGSGKTTKDGELQILNVKTGQFGSYGINHGSPENMQLPEDAGSKTGTTYFGGMRINFSEKDLSAPTYRMTAAPVSDSLIRKLQGDQTGQHLLQCTERFKRNEGSANDICLKPDHFREVADALRPLKTSPVLFVYPGKNADPYFKDSTALKDASLCKYLEKFPEPKAPADVAVPGPPQPVVAPVPHPSAQKGNR